jgi:NAD(P)H-nitrite reductase large subunit
VIKDDVLVGGCLYGDTLDGSWYFQQICGGADISQVRDHLMFGKASIEAAGIRAAGIGAKDVARV